MTTRTRTIKRHVIQELEVVPPNDDCPHSHSVIEGGWGEPLKGGALVHALAEATTMQEMLTALGMGEHNDCKWVKQGRCVYCDDHNVRLYNGDLPKDKR